MKIKTLTEIVHFGMRQFVCLFVGLLILASSTVLGAGEGDRPKAKRILLIFSYNLSFAQQYTQAYGFLEALPESGASYSISQLELDTLLTPDLDRWQKQLALFLPDLREGKFDVVVTFGLQAFELVRRNFAELPQNLPVIFCGITDWEPTWRKEHSQLTGVLHSINPDDSLMLGMKMLPETKKILLLTDWTEYGAKVKREAALFMAQKYPDVELIVPDNRSLSMADMLRIADSLGENSFVLFYGWYNVDSVNFASLQYMMSRLGNRPDCPLFVMHDAMLRYGALGGSMACAREIGERAAELTSMILAGQKAGLLLPRTVAQRRLLNWPQLKQTEVNPDWLPENITYIGRELTFLDKYGMVLLPVIVGGLLLLFCALWLMYWFFRSRRLMREVCQYAEYESFLNDWLENVAVYGQEDHALTRLLGDLIVRFKGVRAHVFQIDQEQNRVIPMPEWSTSLSGSLQERLRVTSFERSIPWFRVLSDRRLLELPELKNKEVVQICGEQRIYIDPAHARSVYVVGIWSNGNLWGFLPVVFGTEKKSLSAFELRLLEATAHMVEIVLERRRNRVSLERSEYEKRLILDSIKMPVLLFDHEMKLIRVNQAALDLIEKTEREVLSSPCYVCFCGDRERASDCPVRLTVADGKMHVKSMTIGGRDYQVAAYPIIKDGKLANVLHTMLDVTEFNDAQRKLSIALEQANKADRAKSYFLASISHELRTPLNALLGFSELLRTGENDAKTQKEYLEAIDIAGESLLNLVNDILDLSKIEADQIVLAPTPTDLAALVRDLLQVFKSGAMQNELKLTLEIKSDLPILRLDQQRMRQLLLNLIGNSVKRTDKGEVKVTIDFIPDQDESGMLEIAIQDSGSGIMPERLENFFEPFARHDGVYGDMDALETGLGMAIAGRLAGKIGGFIDIKNKRGEGCTFTVKVPDVCFAPEAEGEKMDEKTNDGVDFSGLKVVVTDDVPMNLRVLSAMLRRIGAEVTAANSGAETLQILEKEIPVLLLTDLWMPGMNGAELAKKIRDDEKFAAMKIIAVTADSASGESFDMGVFDGILLKPLTLDKLRETLQKYCGDKAV